jgi:hypothetical protein
MAQLDLDRFIRCLAQRSRRDPDGTMLLPNSETREEPHELGVLRPWSLRGLRQAPLARCVRVLPNDLAFTCERAGANSEECTTVARVCQVQRLVRPSATRKAKAYGKPRCFAPATSFPPTAQARGAHLDESIAISVARGCHAEDRRMRVARRPLSHPGAHCWTGVRLSAPCPRAPCLCHRTHDSTPHSPRAPASIQLFNDVRRGLTTWRSPANAQARTQKSVRQSRAFVRCNGLLDQAPRERQRLTGSAGASPLPLRFRAPHRRVARIWMNRSRSQLPEVATQRTGACALQDALSHIQVRIAGPGVRLSAPCPCAPCLCHRTPGATPHSPRAPASIPFFADVRRGLTTWRSAANALR